jgi:hypothetical protein
MQVIGLKSLTRVGAGVKYYGLTADYGSALAQAERKAALAVRGGTSENQGPFPHSSGWFKSREPPEQRPLARANKCLDKFRKILPGRMSPRRLW